MTNAIEALSKPPGIREKKQALAEINSKIAVLQSQLGLKPTMFEFNPNRAVAKLFELEKQCTEKGLASTTLAAPAAPAVTAAATLDAGILTATLSQFRAMDATTRLQFAQDGGALTHADFSSLSPAAKMAHCRAGGKFLDAPQTSNRIVAPGHVSVTPKP
jgi:hypothetical protein